MLHQVLDRRVGVVDQVQRGIDDFAEVVGRDVGGHADRDALAAVDQQVGKARRHHDGLFAAAVEVGSEVDRLLVDRLDHPHRQLREAALGVAIGGRWIAG